MKLDGKFVGYLSRVGRGLEGYLDNNKKKSKKNTTVIKKNYSSKERVSKQLREGYQDEERKEAADWLVRKQASKQD